MKVNVRQLNRETFNRVKHQKVKNYAKQMTQNDINNLLIEFVRDLQKRGYTEEQIAGMTFTINYVNHK